MVINQKEVIARMEILDGFFQWAWERHHNILSWYIRPLFLLPFIYFSYKRSWKGIILTLVALLTSMFWFPRPDVVDPQIEQFLEMEQQYLFGDWPFSKMLLSALVPITMFALAYAFWKHSWKYGIIFINLIAVLKIMWSIVYGEDSSGWSLVPPAVLGLVVCNVVLFGTYQWLKKSKKVSG